MLALWPGIACADTQAARVGDFLDTLGVTTHVDQGYDPQSYVAPLRYLGIRQVRDGTRNIAADLMLHDRTGVRFTLNGGADLAGLLEAARTLARGHALLALEGPNEANNFAITYHARQGGGGGHTWVPVGEFQRDLYAAVRADPVLQRYPVFGPSEAGAETDNAGLQFLVIPQGAGTVFAPGTRFADYANVHNYVSGNGHHAGDNQAWNAADPILDARWDGLLGNHGVTWYRHYRGYAEAELAGLPRVTTETGWDSVADAGGERMQGTILTNTYLAQFRRGWRYTFIYELRDGEGSDGAQGLYHGDTPKPAATYIHNLTTILADPGTIAAPATSGRLDYTISCGCTTVHDLLLQKSGGAFALIVWDERLRGHDDVAIRFAHDPGAVPIHDITAGTTPIRTATGPSLSLALSDHAVILDIADGKEAAAAP